MFFLCEEYDAYMRRVSTAKHTGARSLPVIIEKDEDGMFVVECPVLPGCYAQGKTYDEALENLQEVIGLLLEEEGAREVLRSYTPLQISFQTITV